MKWYSLITGFVFMLLALYEAKQHNIEFTMIFCTYAIIGIVAAIGFRIVEVVNKNRDTQKMNDRSHD